MNGKRIVLFLGAGASRPLGFPVTDKILPEIWNGVNDPKKWRKWSGMKSWRDAAALRNFLRVLMPGLSEEPTSWRGTSIVDIISLLDQLIAEGRSPTPEMGEDDLRRARQLLYMGINGVLRGRKKPELRQKLIAWVLGEAMRLPESRVTLISTNYDTAFELGLYGRLIQWHASIGKVVDFGIPWRDAFKDVIHVRPSAARLAVFKLHGSLNWLRCETCGFVCINVRQRTASLEFWESVWGYNECYCGGRLRSVIVTPSIVLDVRDGNLLSIWNAALEDLRMAHEWVLVGYSLPSEDIAIRSLLLRAFHSRRRKESLRIRVVQWEAPGSGDGEPSVESTRYRLFFPLKNLRKRDYERRGIEAFVQSLETYDDRRLERWSRKVFPRPSWAE